MKRYKGKYRIESTRLRGWDYGSNGMYFITICTYNREHYFGEIITPTMQLSDIGKIAQNYWNQIPKHFPFVQLNEFVVMPNHVHGIIIINKNDDERNNDKRNNSALITTIPNDSINLHRTMNASQQWYPKTVGVIVNQYKRMVTITARQIHAEFAWQARFYDHIIRDAPSYHRIKHYIVNNPKNWTNDGFNKNG